MTKIDARNQSDLLQSCFGPDYSHRLAELLELLELGKPIYENSPVRGQVTAWGDPWEDVRRVVADAVETAKDVDVPPE